MRHFLLRRILLLLPVVWGVVTIVFFTIHLIPGDPVDLILGETAQEADRSLLRRELSLDQPLVVQYISFLSRLIQGNLGRSIQTKRPVLPTILERYPATLQLTFLSICIALALSLPLGICAARRPHTIVDYGSTGFALIGLALPNFVLGPLLILIFAIQLGWLPVSGYEGTSHLILPSLTLGIAMAALLTRMTRSSFLQVIPAEYVACARAKGIPEAVILVKHVLKAALIPILTVVGLQFGALLAGSIITETIFAWPGIGRLTLRAIHTRDYPMVQGCVLAISLSYISVNFLIDLLYAWVDPRIRYEKKTL